MKAARKTTRADAKAITDAPRAAGCLHIASWRARAVLRGLAFAVTMIVAPSALAQGVGQGVVNREYQIKAAFLYNFGREAYIRWPAEALGDESDPFVIGILGRDPFGRAISEIAQHKTVKGRRLVVLRFRTMEDYQPCHILFVGRQLAREQQIEAIQRTAGEQLLIVGETPGFAASGGVVNFFLEQNTVRFEINLDAARQRGLVISSRLLGVARVLGHERANTAR